MSGLLVLSQFMVLCLLSVRDIALSFAFREVLGLFEIFGLGTSPTRGAGLWTSGPQSASILWGGGDLGCLICV